MFRIDVDAHIDESEATWEYLDNGARRFKPVTLDPGAATAPGDARPAPPLAHRRHDQTQALAR